MKKAIVCVCAVVSLFTTAATPARAQSNQLLQGTEVHLRLLTGLSTTVARSGDQFVAEVAQPIYLGNQLVLPTGARVRGTVGGVVHPRRFSIFRGQAAMNLSFRTLVVESREFPAKMSILGLEAPPSGDKQGKARKDVRVDEGQVVEAKHDIKGDVLAGVIGTGGGTVAGAVFSHVTRGFAIGLVGSTAYIMARRGKEVELPAQTMIRVRMDNTVNLPYLAAGRGDLGVGGAVAQ